MKYCKRCMMPDTKPRIKFDENGICNPCRIFEDRKKIDWKKRYSQLEELCNRYRKGKGYDCIIPVSGGKDSHFQVYMMKKLDMHPLLVCVDNWNWTDIGRQNLDNLSEVFGCDVYTFKMNRKKQKELTWKHFVERGEPAWWWEKLVTTIPEEIGSKLNIPLVVYGEDNHYVYSGSGEEAMKPKGVVDDVPELDTKEDYGIESIFLSYFIPWSGYGHMELAKKYGFKALEWKRDGCIEDYIQIDSAGYLVNPWLKYPKFGFARATEVASDWIREGRLTRDEAIMLVMESDHKIDRLVIEDFLNFVGRTEEEFWGVIEKFYNREIFEKVDGRWVLKNPIYKDLLKETEKVG